MSSALLEQESADFVPCLLELFKMTSSKKKNRLRLKFKIEKRKLNEDKKRKKRQMKKRTLQGKLS